MKAQGERIEYPRLSLQAAYVVNLTKRPVTDKLALIDEALSFSDNKQAKFLYNVRFAMQGLM